MRAKRQIAALASKFGLHLKGTDLANRQVRIHTLYAGGAHLSRLLDSVEISFVQTGAGGSWLAIMRAEPLMQLLEIDLSHLAGR